MLAAYAIVGMIANFLIVVLTIIFNVDMGGKRARTLFALSVFIPYMTVLLFVLAMIAIAIAGIICYITDAR